MIDHTNLENNPRVTIPALIMTSVIYYGTPKNSNPRTEMNDLVTTYV